MTTIHDAQFPESDPADANEITPPESFSGDSQASTVISVDSQPIQVYVAEVDYEMSPQFNREALWRNRAIEFAKEGLIERKYLE